MTAALTVALGAGRQCFNRGAWWDAHEHWEEGWKTAAGAEKRWIQGLVQLAAALVNLEKGKGPSSVILGRKAAEKLAGAPAVLLGVDVVAARKACAMLAGEQLALVDARSLHL